MSYKKFEELELRDDFMFGKVMLNKAICKGMLEILLDEKIEDIEYPETQKAINISYQGKSVRLDVYVEDNEHTVYNTEMQQKDGKSSIIFICTFDPFGKGKYQYTFRSLCQEDESLTLEDETTRIFFNTKGNLNDAPEELRKLFEYIETNQPENAFTRSLDYEIKRSG